MADNQITTVATTSKLHPYIIPAPPCVQLHVCKQQKQTPLKMRVLLNYIIGT